MSTDSFVQSTELSNALLSTMRRAAALRSALASTRTGTFPGPTPIAGLPELYAARTTAVPPVARMTSVRGSSISAVTNGTVGSATHWTTPSGAPAATAASASAAAAALQHSRAIGCGLITIAFQIGRAHV